MHDWVKVHLKAYSGASVEERRAWWITLKWSIHVPFSSLAEVRSVGTALAVATTDLFGVYSVGVNEALESLFMAGLS